MLISRAVLKLVNIELKMMLNTSILLILYTFLYFRTCVLYYFRSNWYPLYACIMLTGENHVFIVKFDYFRLIVLNTAFNNSSIISWL